MRLRAFSIVVILAVLLVLAVWVFDLGQQIAGFNQSETRALQSVNAKLEEEATRLRSLLAAHENDLQIEKAAQKELTDKYSALVEENARLKEELAVMERLFKPKK